MDPPTSLFERWIGRSRRPWLWVAICVAVVAAPLIAAALDGMLAEFFAAGLWHYWLPAAVIVYIVAVSGPMSAMESRVIRAFRPVLLLSDEETDCLLRSAAVIKPAYEALAVAAGLVVGFAAVEDWPAGGPSSWLDWVGQVFLPLMYGLLAWVIYGSFAETRLMNVLLRQPLRVDPLDTTPFEPIGRRSLLLALAFVGGSTLSLVFVGSQPGSLRSPVVWAIYGVLALVSAAIFFLNMWPTHRVLAEARKTELRAVRADCRHLPRPQPKPGARPGHRNAGSRPECIGELREPPEGEPHLALQHRHAPDTVAVGARAAGAGGGAVGRGQSVEVDEGKSSWLVVAPALARRWRTLEKSACFRIPVV